MNKKISSAAFHTQLQSNGVGYYCGVPDSLLSTFCWYLNDHAADDHDIAVNEGHAIALAAGYHFATGKTPLVYMQNSGIGNAINPLLSLADPLVMGIPLLLLIGWRGQPDRPDEPQHAKQGLVTQPLLDVLGISYSVLSESPRQAMIQVRHAVKTANRDKTPFAIIVPEGVFETYVPVATESPYELSRERAIQIIIDAMPKDIVVVSTTGKTSRELYEYREKKQQDHARDLLVVGGMGHASAIAQSIAKYRSNRQIVVLDGDGALLMHMGSIAHNGVNKQPNLLHIIINNGIHESVGGQPTIAGDIDIPAIATACGYRQAIRVVSETELTHTLQSLQEKREPVLIEIKVNGLSRANLSRPSIHPMLNKRSFMRYLNEDT